MTKRDDVTTIPAEEVKPGFTLLIPRVDGSSPPRQLDVAAVKFFQIVGGRPMVQITAELVPPEGRPWTVERRVGSKVARLL